MALLGVCLGLAMLVAAVLMRRALVIAADLLVIVLVMLAHGIVALAIAIDSGIEIRSGSATNFTLTQDQTMAAGFVFLGGAGYFLGAALVLSPFVRASETSSAATRVVRRTPVEWVDAVVGPTVLRVITILGLLFATGNWLLNGSGYLARESYQFLTPGSVGATFSLLTDPLGIAVAFCAFAARDPIDRAGSGLAFVALLLAEVASSSRGFSVLVAAGAAMIVVFAGRSIPFRVIAGVAGAAATFVSLCLVIQLRGGPETQGLEAYIPWIADGNFDLGPTALQAAASNLLLSIPVGYRSALAPLPDGFLPISLSPFSGSDSGWYLISPYLQLGYQTPSNGFGQLMAGPVAEQVAGIGAVGLLLSLATFFRSGLPARSRAISQFLSVALTSAGALQLLQYSLRAGMRFIWAGLAIAIAIWVWDRLSRSAEPEAQASAPHDALPRVDGMPVHGAPSQPASLRDEQARVGRIV